MPLFIDSPSQAKSPGVYAVEVPEVKTIDEVSNGYIGLVAQFAWGPVQQVITPESGRALLEMFEPIGSPRSSTGYYSIMKRRGLTVKVVRVLASDATAATLTIAGTGGNVTGVALYNGVLGNSIVATISAATNGVSTSRNITLTLTDPVTGTRTEIYENVPLPTPTTAVDVDVTDSILVASITIAGTMTDWPANGSTNFATATNGSAIVASDYTGTAGSADRGVSLFENEPDVRVLVHDDCGNTIRAAVNSAFATQCTTIRDRRAILDGNPQATWADTKTAAAVSALNNDRVTFVGNWVNIRDDGGVLRRCPKSTCIATAHLNLEPQESYAWEDEKATKYYDMIESVDSAFSIYSPVITAEATETGAVSICLTSRTADGKFCALHGRAVNKSFAVTRRIEDFLALSIKPPLGPFSKGPGVASNQASIKAIIDVFLAEQVERERLIEQSTDVSMNTRTTQGRGEFYIAINGRNPVDMEKIFLLVQIGPNVTVTTSA